jgi:hypothetical protein
MAQQPLACLAAGAAGRTWRRGTHGPGHGGNAVLVPKGAGGVDHIAIDGGLLLIGFSFSPSHSFGNRLLKTLSNCLAIVCLVI